jgi:glycosyltransferase involved in cell wall biosynthesis
MRPEREKMFVESLPPFDRSVSWLGWAYNEEKLIEDYLIRADELLKRTVEDYEIIVIDDCSSDRTNEIIASMMKDNPRIKLIRNRVNMNVGYSSQKAIMSATKEYLFWQTIDWSYDISNLRIFLELLKSYDVVAGVRRESVQSADRAMRPILGLLKLFGIKHITRRSDTLTKAIISVFNYILIRCLFNVPLSDYQNVVFYPTKLIQSIGFESNSSFANPEGLIKAYWRGTAIVEVPISFLPRRDGTAKGTRPKAIVRSVKDILRLWFRWMVCKKREQIRMGNIKRLHISEWETEIDKKLAILKSKEFSPTFQIKGIGQAVGSEVYQENHEAKNTISSP